MTIEKQTLIDAYIILLSGSAEFYNKNEIKWYDKYNKPITIEFVNFDFDNIIVRSYYENNNKSFEQRYHNGKQCGKSIGWYKNKNKSWEEEYCNGKLHGKVTIWDDDENKISEYRYYNDKKIQRTEWNKDGTIHKEFEYYSDEEIC